MNNGAGGSFVAYILMKALSCPLWNITYNKLDLFGIGDNRHPFGEVFNHLKLEWSICSDWIYSGTCYSVPWKLLTTA